MRGHMNLSTNLGSINFKGLDGIPLGLDGSCDGQEVVQLCCLRKIRSGSKESHIPISSLLQAQEQLTRQLTSEKLSKI